MKNAKMETRHWSRSSILLLLLTAAAPARLSAQDGTWSLLSAMPVANSEFAAATIGDRIYCVGGFVESNRHRLFIYEPKADRWRMAADVPHEIHHANVAVFGGKIFVFGGGPTASDHVQIYDPVRDRWSEGAPIPTPRTAVATALAGNRIHVIGGTLSINLGVAVDRHEVYDPGTDSWSTLAPLPIASEHVFAGVLGGRIFVVGGRSSRVNLDATQIYDPATDRWSSGSPLPVPTSGMAVQVFRDRLYVFGGENLSAGTVVPAVQRYDPQAGQWEVLGGEGHWREHRPAPLLSSSPLLQQETGQADWTYGASGRNRHRAPTVAGQREKRDRVSGGGAAPRSSGIHPCGNASGGLHDRDAHRLRPGRRPPLPRRGPVGLAPLAAVERRRRARGAPVRL